MCGIVGCYHKKSYNLNKENFLTITEKLKNRGPDNLGYCEFNFESSKLRFGHRRLSILDLSQAGNQPMVSSTGRYTIVYNGEIYNHNELRSKIDTESKINWRGTSDTETLLYLIEKMGIEIALKNIEGMFSFCIYDKKSNELIFARDKSGEKPLYIITNKEFFAFSSDLSILKKLPNFTSTLCKESIKKYLHLNYIPTPLTIFNGCYKLPSSSYLTINLNKFEIQQFNNFDDLLSFKGVKLNYCWSLDNLKNRKIEKSRILSKKNILNDVESIIEKSISRQLISDVPIGAFLSGGIDSSTIVLLMKKLKSDVRTFTVGFDFLEYDESEFAEKIAKKIGTKHTTFNCSKNEVLDILPKLSDAFAEPFADSSQIPTMLVSKMARQNVTVALSGDGGDEIFGGYNRYIIANKYWKYINSIPNFVKLRLNSLAGILPKQLLQFLLLKTSLIREDSASINNKIDKILLKIGKMKDKYSFYKSLTNEWDEDSEIIESFNNVESTKYKNLINKSSLLSFEESMMHVDFETYLQDDILCKVDRSSMYSSMEVRAPFLAKELIEYVYLLPSKYKISNGKSKIILRGILNKYLPENYFERPKQGFAIPVAHWMRTDLRDWVDNLLSKELLDSHGLFNNKIVERIKNEHMLAHHNHEHKLWSMIQFNQWYTENKEIIND